VLIRSAPTTFHILDVDDFTSIKKKIVGVQSRIECALCRQTLECLSAGKLATKIMHKARLGFLKEQKNIQLLGFEP
jgi:hypothetical protein